MCGSTFIRTAALDGSGCSVGHGEEATAEIAENAEMRTMRFLCGLAPAKPKLAAGEGWSSAVSVV